MKTTFLIIVIALSSSVTFAQSPDDENIKKIIVAETEAAYKNDMEAWQRTWVHSPKANWVVMGNGYSRTISGWDSLSLAIGNMMKNNTAGNSVHVRNDNFNITSDGNMAWVDFQQNITFPATGPDSSTTARQHGYRTLVKENNEWKLLSMISNDEESFTSVSAQAIENSLNATGYNLINANRLKDAIEVFRLNVKLNPKAWNPFDSLGEALALAGNKKEAIENYEKSIKLNPKNDNGVKALEKLKAK